ncbi:MAG: L-2-amino-thiazoline-4-carboxylic acid hydrolase [Deltaproteobacteria bacterium]|nr:L-2-amino-thiazoline-4-carboxylic acid hydrolase [Deltaproteobacteria bacterium]
MGTKGELIPRADAVKAVALTCRRMGMLHVAFAATLVKELGQEKGEELTTKAIKEYARMIGEKKKEIAIEQDWELTEENFKKLSDLPAFGMHDEYEETIEGSEKRTRAYGCVMSKVWHEYGQDKLGRIYCYVDPASVMTFNPEFKMVHTKTVPDGDPFCELTFRSTSEKDKKELRKKTTNFQAIEGGITQKPKKT